MSYGKSDAILIQHASADTKSMLRLTAGIHAAYAEKHGIDYMPFYGLTDPGDDGHGPNWEKNRLLMQAFKWGYRYVFILDLDTLILPDCPDMRTAVPPGAFGVVWHDDANGWRAHDPTGQAGLYDHHNIGCIYVERTILTAEFLALWWNTSDDGHAWGNQHGFRKTCDAWNGDNPLPVQTISRDWNSTPVHPGEHPKVLHWAGYGDGAQRFAVMQQAVAQYYGSGHIQAAGVAPASGDHRVLWQQAIDAREKGDKENSSLLYQRLLAIDPGNVQAWLQYAVLCTEMKCYQRSMDAFAYAAGLTPADPQVWHGLAFTNSFMGNPDKAHFANEMCLKYAPDMPTARWNKSNMLLQMGQWEEGWQEYEYGQIARMRPVRMQKPPMTRFHWLMEGGGWAGRKIVIWPEQGLGDTLMCVRFLKELKERTGAQIYLECQDALYPLLCKIEGADFVYICPKDNSVPVEWDEHCALMSLPYLLSKNDPEDVRCAPYISADPNKSAYWRQVLGGEELTRLRVGISWRGSASHANDMYRSACIRSDNPAIDGAPLQEWSRLKEFPDILVVPLDPDPRFNPNLPTYINNWSDTAAIIDNLDLVICVDTAVAHLAGAMGKAVWMMLPYNNDWRWLMEREDTPWYDGMRLFRAGKPKDPYAMATDWTPVFERIFSELPKWIRGLVRTHPQTIEYASHIPAVVPNGHNTAPVVSMEELRGMTKDEKVKALLNQTEQGLKVIEPVGSGKRKR